MMDSVKEVVKTSNSDLVIVPGGCTKYIQAPDICWNKPFKEFIGTKYDHWMDEGVHQYTEAGNMKPLPRKKIVQWILESWAALSKEVIVESLKLCALNLANDGSEVKGFIVQAKKTLSCWTSATEIAVVCSG